MIMQHYNFSLAYATSKVCQFHNNEDVEMSVHERSCLQKCNRFLIPTARNFLNECCKKNQKQSTVTKSQPNKGSIKQPQTQQSLFELCPQSNAFPQHTFCHISQKHSISTLKYSEIHLNISWWRYLQSDQSHLNRWEMALKHIWYLLVQRFWLSLSKPEFWEGEIKSQEVKQVKSFMICIPH
jgi:hypothetical protein